MTYNLNFRIQLLRSHDSTTGWENPISHYLHFSRPRTRAHTSPHLILRISKDLSLWKVWATESDLSWTHVDTPRRTPLFERPNMKFRKWQICSRTPFKNMMEWTCFFATPKDGRKWNHVGRASTLPSGNATIRLRVSSKIILVKKPMSEKSLEIHRFESIPQTEWFPGTPRPFRRGGTTSATEGFTWNPLSPPSWSQLNRLRTRALKSFWTSCKVEKAN